MKVNHEHTRIGDTILIEPALAACAEAAGPIDLYVTPRYRELYEGNPAVRLAGIPHDDPDVVPSAGEALAYAIDRNVPFAAVYFPQFGLEPRGRLHYEIHGGPFQESPEPLRLRRILIAPYARSCHRHEGSAPNLEPDPGWWDPILRCLPLPAFTLGEEHDATLPNTQPMKGLPLRDVVWEMRRSSLLISVETGILHLAGAARIPSVFLSSATPENVSRPTSDCQVIRAPSPSWDADEVIEAVESACRG
ncbi:hypothetical protein [Singulisphaera sp. PoT]|uniref:hypothetical protein n=1 Tax=Singulisphaera sp. PoT TaxID=3411797 RepID=UPI003BF49822